MDNENCCHKCGTLLSITSSAYVTCLACGTRYKIRDCCIEVIEDGDELAWMVHGVHT